MKSVFSKLIPTFILIFFIIAGSCFANEIFIKNNSTLKTVSFGNNKIKITLDYKRKCAVTQIQVNNEPVISSPAGVFSEIRSLKKYWSTLALDITPIVRIKKNIVEVDGIKYGDKNTVITESWKFLITGTDVKFNIERDIPDSISVEEISFPSFNFNNINTWEGAFLGNGGVAWFYLFNEKLCTYGVHSDYSAFWNSKTDNGLKITAASPGKYIALKYSRSNDDKLIFNVSVSKDEMISRYDSDTHRRRFIREKSDVWSGFILPAGKLSAILTLTPFSYNSEYNRGNLTGLDGKKVTSVLNTIARIGVIDSKLYGGNSWHTPYGPICLHEQYIAQFGIAVNDTNYINGYKQCLDYYRENAVKPDGRVLPRWAYDNSDEMTGTATPLGFYEAQWGYLLDSNPDYVSNVSQLYNLCGDIDWVRKQKSTCEKALEFILNHDSNGNHLVEMIPDGHTEKKGSDWIDIIWASYENAFVNAKLYYALTLWTDIEKQLGDNAKAAYYSEYAAALKKSFNRSTKTGGFWDEENKWYVYWRDKDNSIHGNNFVVPVNLMAVAYKIYENENQRALILDKLENQMQKENLFFWPLCLYSYEKGEGRDNQFPFPKYENGDIFLSWGGVGVEAYASYKPEIALKYIENILARHSLDGLAFQRYGRNKQNGLGDDILSGNCLAIAGLYQSIYGINPQYNRLYLNPHLTEKLYGSELYYNFRGEKLKIDLNKNHYAISNKRFNVSSMKDFGFYSKGNELRYFNEKGNNPSLIVQSENDHLVSIGIMNWDSQEFSWDQSAAQNSENLIYTVSNLNPETLYTIHLNSKKLITMKSSKDGTLIFSTKAGKKKQSVQINIGS